MKKLLITLVLLIAPASVLGADIYITPTGTGVNGCPSGPTTHDRAWFNNSGNWGNSAGQIGPGKTALLCGTFTWTDYANPLFIISGNGTVGNPITILADTGLNLTSPVFGPQGNAAITSNGHTWVTIDGNNYAGTIQNTANGHGLANAKNTTAIFITGSDHAVFKNWNVINMCVHIFNVNGGCTSFGSDDVEVFINASNNTTVSGNKIHDGNACIFEVSGGNDVGNVITGNIMTRCNWGVAVGSSNTGNLTTGTVVSFNDISDAANWDEPNNDFHHNGIILFIGQGTGRIVAVLVNSNFVHGDMGAHQTGDVFMDSNGLTGPIEGTIIINNVLATITSNTPSNSFVTGLASNGTLMANNTISGNGAVGGQGCFGGNNYTDNAVAKNNICSRTFYGVWFNPNGGTSFRIGASDFNVFYNLVNGWQDGPNHITTLAAWTAATGFDVHSMTGDPKLSAAYTLLGGSSAIGTCTNLTSLGIAALNVDKAGNARPGGATPWDCGAFNSGATPPIPAMTLAPSPLIFPNQTQGLPAANLTVTITSSGTANLVFNNPAVALSGGNVGDFSIISTTCTAASIAPAATCQVVIGFTPLGQGPRTTTLTTSANAAGTDVINGSSQVVAPAPMFASAALVPNTILMLNVAGQNFKPTTQVLLDGLPLTTVCPSAIQCVASIPSVLLPGFITTNHTIGVR